MKNVYLETTIPSYLTARPASDLVAAGKQEVTRQWWDTRKYDFSLYISAYVLDEVAKGDTIAAAKRLEVLQGISVLSEDEETIRLAESILAAKIIPERAATDALHIAIATRHGMDFLLTWNCTHIANAEIMRVVEYILSDEGYEMPIICTPDELMGGESE